MRRWALLMTVLCGFCCAGCPRAPRPPGERWYPTCPVPAIEETLANYGGLERISRIDAWAVVTWHEDTLARVQGMEMIIEPPRRRITASGHLPGGAWSAAVVLDGPASLDTTGGLKLSARQRRQIEDVLRLTLHRVCGPLNLLDGPERIVNAEDVFTAGYRLTRVISAGRGTLATAYFFDRPSRELRMVSVGGIEPGQEGTVTLYRNARVDGVMLPKSLHVSAIGRNALLGERKILDVELTKLKAR